MSTIQSPPRYAVRHHTDPDFPSPRRNRGVFVGLSGQSKAKSALRLWSACMTCVYFAADYAFSTVGMPKLLKWLPFVDQRCMIQS